MWLQLLESLQVWPGTKGRPVSGRLPFVSPEELPSISVDSLTRHGGAFDRLFGNTQISSRPQALLSGFVVPLPAPCTAPLSSIIQEIATPQKGP